MQRCAITPYEGTKPYVFVSYAHKDTKLVFPVLEELDRRGYRIWYDDGIAPGSEWPENIAQHLDGCSLTLAFISPNSIASANCRREVTFALSKRKAFLAVILQPTEMSLGMEMQLSAQQCVMKYKYPTEESFLKKLCSCPELEPCRKIPEAPQIQRERKAVSETPAQPVTKTAAEVQPAKAPKVKKEKAPMDKEKLRKLAITGGVVAAALLLMVLIPLLSSVRITPSKKVGKSETYLSLYNETIDADAISGINKLGKLENLVFSGCSFESGALSGLELDGQLKQVEIKDCTGADDLSFLTKQDGLSGLTLDNSGITDALLPELPQQKLQRVSLADNPEFTQLSKLKSESLVELDISGTGVEDLDALASDVLTDIDFSNTKVSDGAALARWTILGSVCGANTQITDISVLAGHEELTTLDFSGCGIRKIDGEFASLRLNKLYLADNELTGIEAFGNCTVLRDVDLSGNGIEDISVLEKSCATLETLDLADMPLTAEDLQFVSECPKLKEVYLDGLPLQALDMLQNAAALSRLSAVDCGLEDISGLSGCTQLSWLRLAVNKITDISPLKNITATGYVTLDLGYNPIKDASALPDLRYGMLSLISDELDLTTLPRITGTTLVVNYMEGMETGILAERPFAHCYVIDCPADKRVGLGGVLGTYSLKFLDSETDIMTLMASSELDYSFLETQG